MDTQEKIEQRRAESAKAQKRNKKRANSKFPRWLKRTLITIGVCLAAAVVVFLLVFPNTGLSRRVFTAVTIGDVDVSTAEFSYYYRAAYQNYVDTMTNYVGASNIPIDSTKSLDKQTMSDGTTYAEYFTQSAITTLTRLIVLSEEAEKAGFEFSGDNEEQLYNYESSIQSSAEQAGMSVNDYLGSYFGLGFNMDLFEKCVRRELYADSYADYKQNEEKQYTDEELEQYYEDNKTTFDTVDVRVATFQASSSDDTEEYTAAQAEADANALIDQATDEASFTELALAHMQEESDGTSEITEDSTLQQNLTLANATTIDTNVGTWLFDESRQVGDKAVVEASAGNVYYALYLVRTASRTETKVVNVRHILFKVDDTTDEDAMNMAEEKAEILLESFLSGDATEDNFAALAVANSEDTGSASNGGLYENVYPGEMVTEFNDWCFGQEHQPGDTGIIQTEYGVHIMYFSSYGDEKWKSDVETSLRQEDYDAYYESVSANYEVKRHALGMSLRSEPLLSSSGS